MDRTRQLTVVRPGLQVPPAQPGETVVAFDEFARWIGSGRALAQPLRFAESRILVHRLESAGRPLPLALALRWMTRGRVRIEDHRGGVRVLDAPTIARWTAQIATEPFRIPSLLRSFEAEVAALEGAPAKAAPRAIDLTRPPLYLRSDLSFGIRAGGSVGHIAGVLNELGRFTAPPIFVTTDEVPTVDPAIEQHQVSPPDAFWNFSELPSLLLNRTLEADIERALAGRMPSFIYQRYSLNNFTGVKLARRLGLPLVLEYNGSEVWVSHHWGRRLKYDALSRRIEHVNIRAADLLVVVSRPIREEVVGLGVDSERVLVNPNGVDTDRYSPEVDGSAVRGRYALRDVTVIGFIGTFGAWHGADVLARAYVRLLQTNPAFAKTTRLLMIGAGVTLPDAKRILSEGNAIENAVFTGLVPQEQGAEHLAACDVLVAPHIPNPDGTPFFGSPTKLFEYMAMGKGIIASKLDQIGEVLEDGRTALLVPPGEVDHLSAAMARLAGDAALRECLGTNARRAAVERHTWRDHTRRTIDALARVVH